MAHNPEIELAHQFVRYTNATIFLTGKAGTGKTTFLRGLKDALPKRMIVVAPTGVAAINAGGVTIHSFFQLPFGPILPNQILNDTPSKADGNSPTRKYRKDKIDIIKSLDLLVIDEISMVRADLLDGIDEVLRKFKKKNKPFGGVQVLMIGDLQQLPPVVKQEEWHLLHNHYKTPFFFSSRAFKQSEHVCIELKHVYRQNDAKFISILNEIRNNSVSEASYNILHQRYQPDFEPKENEGYITLSTHNARAEAINKTKLDELPDKAKVFVADITGTFPDYAFPTHENLVLKKGAQVMFVKNDSSPEKLYYNGKIGIVTGFSEKAIRVKCEGDYSEIEVFPDAWNNVKYNINHKTKAIEEDIVGEFKQYPLKLAWAITIHKSQGLTFERAIIDAESAFAHGQVYVALSRCKTLEGLVLKTRLSKEGIINDSAVTGFVNYMEQHQPDRKDLNEAQQHFEYQLLEELFDFSEMIRVASRCDRQLQDNKSVIQGNLPDKMAKAINIAIPDIKQISEKFLPQLQQYCFQSDGIKNNTEAQERIGKACHYFLSKINDHLMSIWSDYSFETDNQAISKQITKYIEELYEISNIKITCLSACANGFDTKNYMETRAKAMLKKVSFFAKAKAEVTVEHPVLMRRLRGWRSKIADTSNVPIYYIASQQSLVEICNKLPYTTEQLKQIKGFGKKKIERYGEELIQLITAYRQEKGLGLLNFNADTPEENTPKKEKKEKKPKVDTRQVTLEMFKEGKSAEEIAEARNFAVSTIRKHLAVLIERGNLMPNDVMDSERADQLKQLLQNISRDISISDIKYQVGESFSYDEIRYILAYFKQINGG